MSRIFYNSQSQPIQLSHKLGTGGEGAVYEVFGQSEFVAKIYHEAPEAEKAEKLIALSKLSNERLQKIAAWPLDVLRVEADGPLAGFVMKRIEQASEVHALHSPKSRLQKFPEASWAFLIYVAGNIARAVATMHEHGFIVGDLNPKNILVTHQATVTLLDCDSFQVTVDGKTFCCEGGFPEYLPPELQGKSLREIERKPEHDCFGLAVVIFQLLFMGRHPFSGRFLGEGEQTLEEAIRKSRFAFGSDAEARQMQQPPGTLPLEAIPATLNNLFRRAFLSHDRPQPHEWIESLETLTKSLKACDLHTGHFFFNELTECPWCEIEMRARIRLFNFSLNGHNGQRTPFKLDEIWAKIGTLTLPLASIPLAELQAKMTLTSKPSAEVLAYSRGRYIKLIQGVVFSSVAGFMIGCFVPWSLVPVLLLITGVIAKFIADAKISQKGPQVTKFFNQALAIPNNSFAAQIRSSVESAYQTIQQLEAKVQNLPSASSFGSKMKELVNRKDVYERLPKIREYRLKQLETEVNERQLNEFLDRFEINEAQIKDIDPLTMTLLRSRGVQTAADITPENLKQVPDLTEPQAQQLLFWRAGAKRKFKFDPARGVQVQDRLNVEREMDNLRMQLEHDLSTGAVFLQRLQHEMESQQLQIAQTLPDAYRMRAQSEKDWEVAQKQNPLWPLVMLLFIFFFYGCFFSTFYYFPGNGTPLQTQPEQSRVSPDPAPLKEPELSTDETEARMNFEKGEKLMQQAKWAAAGKLFQRATELDPQFQPAYVQLGHALYRQGKYDDSIEASTKATRIYDEFVPNFYLGMAYRAKHQWKPAGDSFIQGITLAARQSNLEEDPRFADAYYYLGETFTHTGQLKGTIQELEPIVERGSFMAAQRFQLATLYLWAGKPTLAEKHRKALKLGDQNLAKQLQRLMIQHRKHTS
ncbi:MAG: tetratricopeptide repeat protein [Acidobacteria bacterium]|nr:tetratricopeptide repeat protein [Acidobacteriota bacterium]